MLDHLLLQQDRLTERVGTLACLTRLFSTLADLGELVNFTLSFSAFSISNSSALANLALISILVDPYSESTRGTFANSDSVGGPLVCSTSTIYQVVDRLVFIQLGEIELDSFVDLR